MSYGWCIGVKKYHRTERVCLRSICEKGILCPLTPTARLGAYASHEVGGDFAYFPITLYPTRTRAMIVVTVGSVEVIWIVCKDSTYRRRGGFGRWCGCKKSTCSRLLNLSSDFWCPKKARKRSIHTGERTYQCVWCNWSFAKSSDLNVRQCVGNKPYWCGVCRLAFVVKTDLKALKRRCHRDTSQYKWCTFIAVF